MILVDTSVWVNHFRRRDAALERLLDSRQVLTHPFIIGELALGNLQPRGSILDDLYKLPKAVVGSEREILRFIDEHRLFRCGVGYVDAHLLASTLLTPDAALWTRDRPLLEAANRLALAARLPS